MTGIVRKLLGVGIILVAVLAFGAMGVAVAQEQTNPEHQNPDEVEDDSDPAALERYLGGRMSEIHVDCSEGMAVGNFDACEDLNGEYESYLGRYVNVEGRTSSGDANRQSDDFRVAHEQQQNLSRQLQTFETTREEYVDARESDNDELAGAKARDLRDQADRINQLSENISQEFRALNASTDEDLVAAANQTEERAEETDRIATLAEEESLERVEFGIESDGDASYSDPGTVSGLVRTLNWNPVTSGEVVVTDDAGFTANATINQDGRWEVPYRPTLTDTGETQVEATFVPDRESPYLGTNRTTMVTVESTPTTITVDNATEQAAYGENVTATGTLMADGDRAENVSVQLRADGVVIANNTTDANGRYNVSGALPAAVPAGNATLEVRGSEPGAALAPSTASRSLTVAETETTLTADVSHEGDQPVVTGELTTADGDPVAGERVTLSADGETWTATTDESGWYRLTPDSSASSGEAVVSYDGTSSNLATSQAEVSLDPLFDNLIGDILGAVQLDGFLTRLESTISAYPVLSAVLGVLFTLNAIIWLSVWWRRRKGARGTRAIGSDDASGGVQPAIRPVGGDVTGLDTARAQLENAPSTAVQVAFATVRSALGMDDARTHWEVYQATSDDLDGDRREALRTVTEGFEAATFSPDGVDRERASKVLEDAERCLTTTDGGAESTE